MSTVDPPPPGEPSPSSGNPGPGTAAARSGFLSTARTMAVTAAVVAGTLLGGGYVVHEITSSDRVTPTTPATSVRPSTGATDPDAATAPDQRPRGRRGEGQFPDPDPSTATREGGFPRGRPASPDGATATTGRA